MGYAVKNDNTGFRAVDSANDIAAGEYYSETIPLAYENYIAGIELQNSKWDRVEHQRAGLTVQVASGHIFAANEKAVSKMIIARDSMGDADTRLWVEDWGSFTATKSEIQEAIVKASDAYQLLINAEFGV